MTPQARFPLQQVHAIFFAENPLDLPHRCDTSSWSIPRAAIHALVALATQTSSLCYEPLLPFRGVPHQVSLSASLTHTQSSAPMKTGFRRALWNRFNESLEEPERLTEWAELTSFEFNNTGKTNFSGRLDGQNVTSGWKPTDWRWELAEGSGVGSGAQPVDPSSRGWSLKWVFLWVLVCVLVGWKECSSSRRRKEAIA